MAFIKSLLVSCTGAGAGLGAACIVYARRCGSGVATGVGIGRGGTCPLYGVARTKAAVVGCGFFFSRRAINSRSIIFRPFWALRPNTSHKRTAAQPQPSVTAASAARFPQALGVCAFHSRFISAFSARSARQSSLVRPVQSTAGPLWKQSQQA